MLELDGCISKGLIRKIPASREHAAASTRKAHDMLKDAKANLEEGRFDAAALLGYVSMLNAGRALLFRDGYTEKSHYCVARYLEAKYVGALGREAIRELDSCRQTRHEVQYSAAHHTGESEAENLVRFAGEFLSKIEELLEG